MVAKVSVDSGTNTKPSPTPWITPEMITSRSSICSSNPVIIHSDQAVSPSPISTSARGSKRLTSRPTRIMEIMVPMPRGAITSPVLITG